MCEEFPLSLVEQVIPIIDLMARTSTHFARLRDFIKLEFPPGFPVKIGTVKGTTGALVGSVLFVVTRCALGHWSTLGKSSVQ